MALVGFLSIFDSIEGYRGHIILDLQEVRTKALLGIERQPFLNLNAMYFSNHAQVISLFYGAT